MASPDPNEAAPRIFVETGFGRLVIALYPQRAPASCRWVLSLVDRGAFDPCGIFRITTDANHSKPELPRIHVVQLGHACADPDTPVVIPHEHTKLTGLLHLRGVVSLPRYRPGATYESFFICCREEPSLDFGGKRNPDGQGFAAFGELVSGWEVLDRVVQQSGSQEYLENPLPVTRVGRVHDPAPWAT